MENSQQTHNIFFEKISAEMKATTPEKIISDLEVVILNNGNGLTLKQFELLGSLAYLTGIDFTSQSTGFKAQTLRNVTDRFISQNITPEVWSKFLETIKLLHIDTLIESKEFMKSGVTSKLKTDAQTVKMKHAIVSVIKSAFVPVKSVMNIDELIKSNGLTYMNLLNFNSIVYEQMSMKGSSINMITSLLSDEKFVETMKLANSKFDDQKFAIIYFDSLVTLLEFMGAVKFEANVLFNDVLIEELKTAEQTQELDEAMSIKTPEQIEAEKVVSDEPEFEMEDTDNFLKASIDEALGRKIETLDDLIEAFNSVFTNEDLMQHVYKFMRTKQKINRKSIFEIYGFSADDIVNHYNGVIAENVEKYNTLVSKYIQPIPENLYVRLISAVNDTIKSLLISDSELKGYLIQQIHENQITTYKQLHQTIGFIERCDIDGSKLNTYVALRDMIMFSDDIVNIFEESIELDNLKLRAQFFTAIKDFYAETIKEPTMVAENPAE